MKDTGNERRKKSRYACEGDYYFHPGIRGKVYSCTLKNISVTGACIETIESLLKDQIIYLHVNTMDDSVLKSRVVWHMGEQYGLLFLLETSQDFDTISYIINNRQIKKDNK